MTGTVKGIGNGATTSLAKPIDEQNKGGVWAGLSYLLEKAGLGFAGALEGLVDYTVGGIAELTGNHKYAESLMTNDWFDYSHADSWFVPDDGWKLAGDVAAGIGNSVPGLAASVGVGIATGGMSTVAQAALAGTTTFLTSGLSAAGNSVKDAYRETGKLGAEEWAYGTGAGALEGTVETFSDTVFGLGFGAAKKAARGIFGKDTVKTIAHEGIFKTMAKGFAGEAGEEIISAIFEPYIKRATYDPNAENASLQEIAYSALVGGLSGMIMSGVAGGVNAATNVVHGANIENRGETQRILTRSEQIANTETSVKTESDAFRAVDSALREFKASVETHPSDTLTVKQKMLLGYLDRANTVAAFQPYFWKEATNILSNPEGVADAINRFYSDSTSGEKIHITAEELLDGVDMSSPQAYRKSIVKALKTNQKLRTLTVLRATERLTMNTEAYTDALLAGEDAAFSQEQLNTYIENAKPHQLKRVTEALGVQDLLSETSDVLRERVRKYRESVGEDYYKAAENATQAFSAVGEANIRHTLPKSVHRAQDGVRRYRIGDTDLGILQMGKEYRFYDYNEKGLSRPMKYSEAQKVLTAWREEAGLEVAGDKKTPSVEMRERIEDFAKKNVPEYTKLNAPDRQAVRMTIRQAMEANLSEESVTLTARFAAHSGLIVMFHPYLPGDGMNLGNVIYLNPRSSETRLRGKLLIHELDHILVRQKNGNRLIAEAMENIDPEKRRKVIKQYEDSGVYDQLPAKEKKNALEDEVASAYAEEIASDPKIWDYILSEKPTTKERVLSFFRRAARDYSFDEKMSAEAKRYLKQFKKLFDTLSEQNATYGSGARFALSNALKELGEYDATRVRHIESSGKDHVSRNYEEIVEFIENSRKKTSFSRLHIGIISDKTADLVKASTGIDIKNYDFVLASNFIYHIYNSHGNETIETPRGQKAVNDVNIKNILETVISPADVKLVSDSTGTALRFEKTLDGKNIAIAITSTKKGTLTLKSAWIINEKSGGHTPSANANAFAGTPETNGRNSTTDIISEKASDVNPSAKNTGTDAAKIAFNKNEEDPAHFILRLKSLEKAVPTYDRAESSANRISENSEKVNPFDEKNSESAPKTTKDARMALPDTDSEGKKLSDGQRKYFDGTKVVDANGNLLRVYHGSPAIFTEFSYRFMSTNGSAEGQGFYFTQNKEMAEGYSKEGGQLLDGYLSIKKPLSDSKVTLTRAEVKKLVQAIDPTGDDVIANFDSEGGMGYPSKAWYNRALTDTVNSCMDYCDSDSEILANIANSGAGAETVLLTTKRVLGYDGYIVDNKYENSTVYVAFTSEQFKSTSNKTPTVNPDIRFALSENSENASRYTYDALIAKKDMKVTALPKTVPTTEDGKIDRKAIVALGRMNARSQKNPHNTDTNVYVYVDDIGRDVLLSREGMQHGIARSKETALAVTRIGDVLKSSIAVNELNGSTTRKTEMSYVLLGACRDGENLYVVRSVVSRIENDVTEIDVYRLGAVKSKKTETPTPALGGTAVTEQSSLISSESPAISISDFLEKVKTLPLANEIFSQDVLQKLGIKRSVGTLSDSIRFALPEDGEFTFSEGEDGSLHVTRNYMSYADDPTHVRQATDISREKYYSKTELEASVNSMVDEVMQFNDEHSSLKGKLKGKTKSAVVNYLWQKFNKSASEADLQKSATDIADYIIENTMVEEIYNDARYTDNDIEHAEAALTVLRGFMHNMNLKALKGEIKYTYDDKANGVFLTWGKKEGGFTADVVAIELKESGLQIEVADSEAECFFNILDLYQRSKEILRDRVYSEKLKAFGSEAEIAALRDEIVKKILSIRELEGKKTKYGKLVEEYSEKVRTLKQKNEDTIHSLKQENAEKVRTLKQELRDERRIPPLENRVLKKVQGIKDWKSGVFQNATQYRPKILMQTVGKLSSIAANGNIRDGAVRKVMRDLYLWYSSEGTKNMLEGSGRYNSEIAGMLSSLAEDARIMTEAEESSLNEVISLYNKTGLSLEGLSRKDAMTTLRDFYTRKNIGDAYSAETKQFLSRMAKDTTLSAEELNRLGNVVDYFKHFVENFNRVFRDGKWQDVAPLAESMIHIAEKAKTANYGISYRAMRSKLLSSYRENFSEPMTVAKFADGYDQNGFFTTSIMAFREAEEKRSFIEHDLRQRLEDFYKKKENRKWLKRAQKETVIYNNETLTKREAAQLYMTFHRDIATAGLLLSGFEIRRDAETLTVRPIAESNLTAEQAETLTKKCIAELKSQFSASDLEFISIAEEIYKDCRELKRATDMLRNGYSNVTEGYYVPVVRIGAAKSFDSDFFGEGVSVNRQSFNKSTVKGAKAKLVISPIDEVLSRHIEGISRYAAFGSVLDTIDMIWNYDISGNPNNPTSMRTTAEKSWRGGEKYLTKLKQDCKGIGRDGKLPIVQKLIGKYATAVLALNPKVLASQLSSLLASTSILDVTSLIRGATISSKDVDVYCKLAQVRNYDKTAYRAQAVTDKIGSIGEVLMEPIGKVDRFVVKKLFGACQVQIQKEGGAKIGTVENKQAAGKLLERVILETQQNAYATERSEAMRSGNDFLRLTTLFSADSMKVFDRILDSWGEWRVLTAKLKAESDPRVRAELQAGIKKASKSFKKATFALASSAVYMALIAEFFRWFFGQKDEDENLASNLILGTIGNLFGGLPLIKDVMSFMMDGYEMSAPTYDMINNAMNATKAAAVVMPKIIDGTAEKQEAAKATRDFLYAASQMLGVPLKNAYKLVYGVTSKVSARAGYVLDDLFYQQNYRKDLVKAIENEDDDMTDLLLSMISRDSVGVDAGTELKNTTGTLLKTWNRETTEDGEENPGNSTSKTMKSLLKAGQNPLPKSIGNKISYDGDEYELSGENKALFRKIYGQSADVLERLVTKPAFLTLNAAEQTKAIRYVYDTYYQQATETVLDTEKDIRTVAAKMTDVGTLALVNAKISSFEADKNKNGTVVSGTKKKKVLRYIASLGLPVGEALFLLYLNGYSVKDGELRGMSETAAKKKLLRYIQSSTELSAEERVIAAEACGFTVKGGKVLVSAS